MNQKKYTIDKSAKHSSLSASLHFQTLYYAGVFLLYVNRVDKAKEYVDRCVFEDFLLSAEIFRDFCFNLFSFSIPDC